MPRLFLSYRRDDSQDVTGRIYDRLVARFGSDSVFMDVDTIPFGVDFRHYLSEWVAGCDAVLVMIGPRWLDAVYPDGPKAGQRRLDDPTDFVRIEVAAALARRVPVVPVLVGGAAMPAPDRLPTDLTDLSYRHAAEVRSGRDFNGHMKRLVAGLEQMPVRPAQTLDPPPVLPPLTVSPPAVSRPTNLNFAAAAPDGMPPGWFNGVGVVGRVSADYDIRVRPRTASDEPSVRLSKKAARSGEFGTLMQRCPAGAYVCRDIRFEGAMRTLAVTGRAGLWLRIDGVAGSLFFNNMSDRPVSGTTDWKRYLIQTTVPADAVWLNYGVLLKENGAVWASDFTVAAGEPVT